MHEANGARRNLNIKGLGALDLRTTKPDGEGWNFARHKDRHEALQLIKRSKPDFIIGSPPCTPFCSWNQYMNYRKMDQNEVDRLMKDGRTHLDFMVKIYRHQVSQGRYFLHEHPAGPARGTSPICANSGIAPVCIASEPTNACLAS